ncbi:MAG: bifunctional 2-polyprenyl-6-hydroxyphenol methylase/3-demethylubiquinol 3-O-methyltransferase UbiG [Legionella sp.]|nr:MAG: bifunctional 2-polyprenyl-6-hydroxyphenol methylase/3-demethylubiquinol 3-O-methyltransferase UbiG [Legionella sp.]
MTNVESTIDIQELNKFAQHAETWWDPQGPLKTLHDINPARMQFITQHTTLEDKQVLDVGCGGGILSEAMAKAGAQVVGLDAEVEAINTAQAHASASKVNVDYICSPIEDYDHAPFDVITCMEMLEHVPKPELVLEHCMRLLKPGGLLLVSTINRSLIAYGTVILAAEYILRILPRQTHDFDKFITPSELATMGRQLDLELIDLQGLAYNPLSRKASLSPDVTINYLLAWKKR